MSTPGSPCWAEVDVDDPERVTAFYAAVLGWTFTDDGAADHHVAIALVDGRPVAALGSVGAAPPPAWTPYFAVEDADEAGDRVTELGGTVLDGPEDAGDAARAFVAVDTGGAVFGGREDDAATVRGAGALVWVEAASADPGQARTFLRNLFGYRYEPGPEEGAVTMYLGDGSVVGGIGFAGDALPHWSVHFAVADVDAAADAAGRSGGTVVTAPHDDAGGRRALLEDPTGARFGVMSV